MLQGLEGIRDHDEVIVLTWLDRARRDVLRVHPHGDLSFLTAYRMEAPTPIDPTIGYTGPSITDLA